jgi:hypothetical protein
MIIDSCQRHDLARAGLAEAEVRLRAYQKYLERAGAPGDPVADWAAAEDELKRERPARAMTEDLPGREVRRRGSPPGVDARPQNIEPKRALARCDEANAPACLAAQRYFNKWAGGAIVADGGRTLRALGIRPS